MSEKRKVMLGQVARFFRHKIQADLVLRVEWESSFCPPQIEAMRSKFEQMLQAQAIADQIKMEELYNKLGEELCRCMERAAHPTDFMKAAMELAEKSGWPPKDGGK